MKTYLNMIDETTKTILRLIVSEVGRELGWRVVEKSKPSFEVRKTRLKLMIAEAPATSLTRLPLF